jgi:hypothetical protein
MPCHKLCVLCVLQGPLEPVYRAALALGTANQLTNILRDVGEDLETRNRIYVPLDELQRVSHGAGGGGGDEVWPGYGMCT